MSENKEHKLFFIGAIVVVLALSIAVAALMVKNIDLKARLENASSQSTFDQLEPGDRVHPFQALTLDSSATKIEYSDSGAKYLLLFLSTTCPYCKENIEKWKGIAQTCQSSGCYVVGISVHDVPRTRQYMIDNNTPFYTVINVSQEFAQEYKIRGVPVTILIKDGGVVEKVWRGALTSDQNQEILAALTVKPLH